MYAALPLLFCGSGLAREGGLTADQYLSDVPDLIVGASLLAMTAYQSKVFIVQSNIQTIPTRLSGCLSEARSLAFDRRCQFSGRDCKPANSR